MDKRQSHDNESFSDSKKSSKLRNAAIAAGSTVAAGAGLFVASRYGVDLDSTLNGTITPEPQVYPEAVDAMVAVNEGVRTVAMPTMLVAMGAYAYARFTGRFSAEYEMSKHDYAGTDSFTESNEAKSGKAMLRLKKAMAGVGLAATTVLLTGASSGIEHEISNGPLRPIEQTFDMLSSGDGQRQIIVQSENNSFMDDADVSKADLRTLAERAAEQGIQIVPFNKTLQNIENRPGLIITVPDELFAKATDEVIDKHCETVPVMLDEVSDKTVGEAIDINGVRAKVVKELSNGAQMNRDVAVMAESDLSCIRGHENETTFGAIVSGGKPGQTEALFTDSPLSEEAALISEEQFNDNNRDFWRKNGTPLVLQLMGYIGALSYIGIGNERRGALQRNVQAIAALHSQGVGFKTIKRIESIRAIRESLKATVIAAPLMPLAAAAFNAAEVGLRVGVGLKEIAVGGAITLAAKFFGGRRAVKRFQKNLNTESALKG